MSWAKDFAELLVNFCNDECVEVEKGGHLIAHGMYLNYDMLVVVTKTCTPFEREQIMAELPMWAQRQIQRSVDEANALTDRVTDISRGRARRRASAR